ncbi:MAG: regulatory protein RecX [Herbinix sp.]|nr:regulatory protein RecX [Herbinix sp.]
MIVTRLEELEQSKVKVYIDDSYAFLLYQKDIENFGLKEETVISQTCYEKILEDTVYRRAKQKALAILKFMDRTEQELRIKLTDAGYPEDIVKNTLAYVAEYGYLNDERYTASYVRARMNSKSKLVIKTELLHKGISKDIIDEIFQSEYDNTESNEDAELTAIRKAVAKKTKSPETLSPGEKQKLMASLYRKGFEIGKIKKIVN